MITYTCLNPNAGLAMPSLVSEINPWFQFAPVGIFGSNICMPYQFAFVSDCRNGIPSNGISISADIFFQTQNYIAVASEIISNSTVCSSTFQFNNKDNIKYWHYLPFVRGIPGDQWIPSQRASNAERASVSIFRRHPVASSVCTAVCELHPHPHPTPPL